MANEQNKAGSSEQIVSLFNFTYALGAIGIAYIIVAKLVGRADPLFVSVVLGLMAVVVPPLTYFAYKRRLANGDLALGAPDSSAGSGEPLAKKLEDFLYLPELENDIFTFTRANPLRAFPMSFGAFTVFVAGMFLGAPRPGVPSWVWFVVMGVAIMMLVGGYFWKYRFSLNLKERTLTTAALFGKSTVPVRTIGAEACWVLGTESNQIVLRVHHALFAQAGEEIVRISNFEAPGKPVFSAAEELARKAGVPFANGRAQASRTASAGPAVYLETWMIALPMSFIVTMLAIQALQMLR